jgi:hypothetical protein
MYWGRHGGGTYLGEARGETRKNSSPTSSSAHETWPQRARSYRAAVGPKQLGKDLGTAPPHEVGLHRRGPGRHLLKRQRKGPHGLGPPSRGRGVCCGCGRRHRGGGRGGGASWVHGDRHAGRERRLIENLSFEDDGSFACTHRKQSCSRSRREASLMCRQAMMLMSAELTPTLPLSRTKCSWFPMGIFRL